MSWRELDAYVRHLPVDSGLGLALYGAAATWRPDTYLLADLFDVYVAVHTKGQPKKYPRPRLRSLT